MSSSSKLPTPVVQAREKMQKLGLDITKENIEKHIDPTEINKWMSSLRTTLKKTGNERARQEFDTVRRNCIRKLHLSSVWSERPKVPD